ncbi:MAG: UDP-N-acetylmuramoyl-L-alanine--D-glutamate ligase [Acidimicrobiales bacterium]
MMRHRAALVIGFAVTGQAAARALRVQGFEVTAVDDGDITVEMAKVARELGIDLLGGLSPGRLREVAGRVELVVLSPGVPPSHVIFKVADPAKIVAEVELAFSLTKLPVVAITGTNGKTTVTSLVTAILLASGKRAEAVGNIGRPFIEAVSAGDAEIFVVEVSSFQLAWTKDFRPGVACWLNLAEDHLDWHGDLQHYAAAKARVWSNQHKDDLAVVNAEDPVVMKWASSAPGRVTTFGRRRGDISEHDGIIRGPTGGICAVGELPRCLPHDVTNAAAAAATALGAGADAAACRAGLMAGVPMPHRIALVARRDGVAWYDDSKATTPSAVLAALSGFDGVVLIAGGRNKGLDLGAIVEGLRAEGDSGAGPGLARLRGVVAIGESSSDIVAAFQQRGGVTVRRAASMAEAVETAGEMARPGDSVLLSPGCASFDWYRDYGERGDDFARAVQQGMGRPLTGDRVLAEPRSLEHLRRGGTQ